MPSASSAAGFVELIAPVAFTSSNPVGILRVTSSVSRSDSCARSCASECNRASSFSCVRSFSITPCMEAAMNAEGFSTSVLAVVQPSLFARAWSRMNLRSRNAATTMPANNTTASATAKAMLRGREVADCGWTGAFIGGSLWKGWLISIISLAHHQQRLIPIYERRGEKHHQQSPGSQKCAKRQFVVRILAARQNDRHAQHAAEQRTRQNRQQRTLRAEKRPGHQHHFHIAQAHAFAPTQSEIRLGYQPQQAAADGRAQNRVHQRQHRPRGRVVEQMIREPKRRAV